MSRHDDLFARFGTPQLMQHFADEGVASVLKKSGEVIVADIDAILGPIGIVQVDRGGMLRDEEGRRIDIRKDPAGENGLADSLTSAHIQLADGTEWSIESVESETESLFRFITTRHKGKALRRPGFYEQ